MGGLIDARPRYGAANVGYDMNAAEQYPQLTVEQMIQLGILGGGAGLGAMGAAPLLALGGATGARGVGPAMGLAGSMAAGAGMMRGTAEQARAQYANRDAEGQSGGFYGPRPYVDPRDAEGQPGGFYGMPRR